MTIMFDAANGFISLVGINGRHQSANKKKQKKGQQKNSLKQTKNKIHSFSF